MANINNSEKNDKVSVSSGYDNTGSKGGNKAQSAGAPGSAGIVGSKRWIAAHTDKMGNITTESDQTTNK